MKRKVTLFLVFCVLFTATLIAGTYSGGSGTSGAPYQIADLDDLQELQNTSADWGAYFIQTADIDASATSGWDGGAGFSPIGNGTTPFTGTYNGQGSAITGLTINRASTNYIGLFGFVDGGEVQNIGVTTASIAGNFYVGAVAGQLLNSADIENGFSSGTITGNSFVGGITGSIEDGSTLLNSGSVATVTGERYVGGLVGRNLATITNCYASGSVNGTVSDEGGLVGGTAAPVVSNSFWDTETSGQTSSSGGTGKSTTEMKTLATYTSTATSGLTTPWDFIGTPSDDTGILDWWNMDAAQNVNSGYPVPSFMPVPTLPAGAGSQASPYIIASLNNLYWLTTNSAAWVADKYYTQTADIAAYSTAYIYSGQGFSPIGNGFNNFYGNYDGGGHTVTGLTIKNPEIRDYVGFFGYTNGAVIQNLNLREVDIIVDHVSGTQIGGLIGYHLDGSVTRCSCTGNVETSGSAVGGLIGMTYTIGTAAATVAECWSSGTVSGSYGIGGLIGCIYQDGNDGTIIVSDCYSTAAVSALLGTPHYAGGLIGWFCNSANATIEHCYSTGSVTPLSSAHTGGFIGWINSGGTNTATACFWDLETSGQAAAYGSGSTGTISGITGKTTAEMKGITAGNTIADWGWSTSIWQRIGENYPCLINNTDPTLPVTLSAFTAQYIENTPTLYWSTQSETDNMGWFVYRNIEEDFTTSEKISEFIEGHGTTTQQQSYIYEDQIENPEVGDTYYYWLESIDYSGMVNHYDKVAQLTIPDQHDPGSGLVPVPERYGLFQNEPNPVISSTKISFNLHETAQVELKIYNLRGQLVKSLYSGMTTSQSLAWDGSDNKGRKLSAGVYLYKLIVNGKTEDAKKLILIK